MKPSRLLAILCLGIFAAACSDGDGGSSSGPNPHEARVCIDNDVEIPCAEFDKKYGHLETSNPAPSTGNGSGTTTPVTGTMPTPKPTPKWQPSEVASCVVYVVKRPISQNTAERLCTKNPAIGYCVADVVRAPISQVDAERLCSESTELGYCVAETIRAPISQVDAERLCRK